MITIAVIKVHDLGIDPILFEFYLRLESEHFLASAAGSILFFSFESHSLRSPGYLDFLMIWETPNCNQPRWPRHTQLAGTPRSHRRHIDRFIPQFVNSIGVSDRSSLSIQIEISPSNAANSVKIPSGCNKTPASSTYTSGGGRKRQTAIEGLTAFVVTLN